MNVLNRIRKGIGWGGSTPSPPATPAAPTSSHASSGTSTRAPRPSAQSDGLNLVNYSPEELVEQVNHSLERVQFGWSGTVKLMEGFSEIWSVVGPLVLVFGTIGEVFLVLWLRQRVQDIIAGVSIVAVALVLEGTFLAVSYKAATIRNRAERRTDGPTAMDGRKLRRQFLFWIALAFGVCATQVIFIAAQTMDTGIGQYGVWTFAILRAVFTLVADGYTAFAHEEKPTTAERALEEQEQRAKHAEAFLHQKKQEVTILNQGTLELREAHTEATIKEEKQITRLQVERLQNKAEIDALKQQQENAAMFIKLNTSLSRALFDVDMPDEQRVKLLQVMQGLMSASKALPPGYRTTVHEEPDTGDLR